MVHVTIHSLNKEADDSQLPNALAAHRGMDERERREPALKINDFGGIVITA